MIRSEMFWSNLLLKLTKQGGLDYNQLKELDVHEFFIILINYEKEIEEKIEQQKR